MTAALMAGLAVGYGVALPIGAIGTYLAALSARTSLRIGCSAAIGVATADGVYALAAVLGGGSVSAFIRSIEPQLRVVAAVVLLRIAIGQATRAVRDYRGYRVPQAARALAPTTAYRAYVVLLGMTSVNPTTVLYFAALTMGSNLTVSTTDGLAFTAAVFVASASWQLVLAASGVALGRVLTGRRGKLATALISGAIVAVFAIHTGARVAL